MAFSWADMQGEQLVGEGRRREGFTLRAAAGEEEKGGGEGEREG